MAAPKKKPSKSKKVDGGKLVRCSKMIDEDPQPGDERPTWTEREYFAMDAKFCAAMRAAGHANRSDDRLTTKIIATLSKPFGL